MGTLIQEVDADCRGARRKRVFHLARVRWRSRGAASLPDSMKERPGKSARTLERERSCELDSIMAKRISRGYRLNFPLRAHVARVTTVSGARAYPGSHAPRYLLASIIFY